MKKIKLTIILLLGVIFVSGCSLFKVDTMDDINIITTNYSLEYITKYMYGDHSLIKSIYPDGININEYEISDKMLDSYSKEDLFIYLGYGKDKDIAVKLINKQNGLLIIDGSHGMSPDYLEELWLYPPNLIMLAQNIKIGLSQYIDSNYLVKSVEEKYDDLTLKLSELDADYKLTCDNAPSKTIVTSTKLLNFLKKYGYNVISLDDDNTALNKSVAEVNNLIEAGEILYIYGLENVPASKEAQNILDNNKKVKEIKLKKLDVISAEDRENNEDYFSIMNKNLDEIKKETYK